MTCFSVSYGLWKGSTHPRLEADAALHKLLVLHIILTHSLTLCNSYFSDQLRGT